MAKHKEIIIKEATREKAELVETNTKAILRVKEGTSMVAGLKVKRIKNIFIVI